MYIETKPNKNSSSFLKIEITKLILKFICKYERPKIAKAILKKQRKKVVEETVLHFNTSKKPTVIKTV